VVVLINVLFDVLDSHCVVIVVAKLEVNLMVALVAVLRADMVVNVVVLPARTARWVSWS